MNKRLLTNSLIFFVGTIIFSVFNYLYNSMMGRILGPAGYSVIGSLLAFIAIITIPTNAVATATMRFTATYHAKNEDGKIHGFLELATRWLFILGLVVATIVLLASHWLVGYLHLPSIIPIFFIAPLLILTILLPLNRGILQGLQNFTQAVVNTGIDPLLKLIIGVGLVKLGFGINGAIGALILSASTAYALSFIPLQSILKQKSTPMHEVPAEIKQFSVIALVAFLLATLLMNVDILLVKHFLPPYEAGLYTALSMIGKIVLFVTTPIVSVMFPMISDLQGRDEKHYRVLLQSIVLVTAIGLVGVVGYFLLPHLVVSILFGPKYLAISPLLGLLGVVILLYSLIKLWINYFFSIGDRLFIWPTAVSVVVEVALLTLRHADFMAIIQDLLTAMVLGFVLLTGYYLFLKRRQIVELLSGVGFLTQ